MPTRALMIGLGSIGQRHARNLRALLGEELVLSALRSRRGTAVVTDHLAIGDGDVEADCDGGIFTDIEEALAPGPDLVFVCTPTGLHVPAVRAAVGAGAAVFVEKPLSSSMDGIAELLEEAGTRQAVVAVGCQMRFHPALRRLRDLLAAGAIGRVVHAQVEQGEYLPSFHPYEDYRQSYASRRDLGGGVVLTQIHELDYVQWLFGVPTSVFAVGGRLGDLDIDVEDVASILFRCEVGGSPLPVHVHLDYLQQQPRRTCRVVGTAGTVEVDLLAPSLVLTDPGGKVDVVEQFPHFERGQLFRDELRQFLGAARGEEPVVVDLAHAAATLQIALSVLRSLETGVSVQL